MREAARPIEERLSVLDRPRADTDALPGHFIHPDAPLRWDDSTVRLALVVADAEIWIGRGLGADEIFHFYADAHGGGSSGSFRSVLASHGALVMWSRNAHRAIVHGVVPDSVTAVRVGAVDATVSNNAFLAAGGPDAPIVLTTTTGERVFPRPDFGVREPEPRKPAPPGGYVGRVEYAWSGYPVVEIDDLDADDWHGVPSGVFLASGNAPEVWLVGVVLLEGPRAGELATADLVVRRSDAGDLVSVEFVGRTAFGPHPDPPRLDAARRRFDQLQRGLDPFGDS